MISDFRRWKLALALAGLGVLGAAQAQPAPSASADESQRQLAEAVQAIQTIDMLRLQRERPYAEQMLVHIERLRATAVSANRQEAIDDVDYLRLFALPTAQRIADTRIAIDSVLDRRPGQAAPYVAGWYAALRIDDDERAIRMVESAARTLRAAEWPQLRRFLEDHSIWAAIHAFDGDTGKRARLADALLTIGWPDNQRRGAVDSLRIMAIDGRLVGNDVAAANGIARLVLSPNEVLRLSVLRRYDRLFADGEDRVARFRRALGEFDAETTEALAAAPGDHRIVLERAQFLRGLGREADALALLMPFTRDVEATVGVDENGMWLVNEAGYSLLELGRDDEAVALFGRLSAQPIADSPGLIGPMINHGVVLFEAGRYADALAHSRRLEQELLDQYANDFGRLWVASTIVCSLARLNRAAEAAPWMTRLRAGIETNGGALTRALLCLEDLDEAERVMVRRLQAEDPETALLALQDYQLRGTGRPPTPLEANRDRLRERPAVRAAAERVGHLLSLPIARGYWGRS